MSTVEELVRELEATEEPYRGLVIRMVRGMASGKLSIEQVHLLSDAQVGRDRDEQRDALAGLLEGVGA